jgi:hypothetical protein
MNSSTPAPTGAIGTPVVRLSGVRGLVAAVPQFLGFEPEQSLVLLCLTHPRGRVGPVARIDLPPPACAAALRPVLECARRYADEVAVVCYHSDQRPACIDDLTAALRDRGIPVVATLSVSGGRIRDARSRAAMRRDRGVPLLGPDDEESLALRSAAILTERLPLPNRQALAASIAPPNGWDDAEVRQAVVAHLHELASDLRAARSRLTPALVRRVDAAFGAAGASYRATGSVPAPAAARLIALAQDSSCRDLLIARAVAAIDAATVGLIAAVAAQCPTDYCAQWCAILAAAAYRYGDGAMAHCALDRVATAQPGHRMARLLRAAMDACLPPESLRVLASIPIPDAETVSPDTSEAGRSQQ